jgi:hypothetical protein
MQLGLCRAHLATERCKGVFDSLCSNSSFLHSHLKHRLWACCLAVRTAALRQQSLVREMASCCTCCLQLADTKKHGATPGTCSDSFFSLYVIRIWRQVVRYDVLPLFVRTRLAFEFAPEVVALPPPAAPEVATSPAVGVPRSTLQDSSV